MATYQITHFCGHEASHSLFGPHKERNRKIRWLEITLCTECWKAEQAAKAAELPALTGTDKQITLAESIRAKMLAECAEITAQIAAVRKAGKEASTVPEVEAQIAKIAKIKDSRYFIDNRNFTARQIIRKAIS